MRKIFVTGGSGFLGQHVIPLLQKAGNHVWAPTHKEIDLLDYDPGHIEVQLFGYKPDVIIHMAGSVGGIGFNQGNQGRLGLNNLKMGMNVLEAFQRTHEVGSFPVKKLIMIGTTCSYPHTPKTIPFIEDELYDGMPELTNSGYGIAKRTLMKLSSDLATERGLNVINLIPTNMIGEFDHFEENKSHVVPALIKKFEDAINGDHVTLWGDGSATRDFIYAGDVAQAILSSLDDKFNFSYPINLGSGREVSIFELAHIISHVGNYRSKIQWDLTKPNGQPRRALNINRAKTILSWEPKTHLEEAIKRSIDWYRNAK